MNNDSKHSKVDFSDLEKKTIVSYDGDFKILSDDNASRFYRMLRAKFELEMRIAKTIHDFESMHGAAIQELLLYREGENSLFPVVIAKTDAR